MDQEIRSTGGIISGVILIIAGLFCLMPGAGIIAAYPDKVWPIGLVLLVCAGFIFYGAIKSIRISEREKGKHWKQA